MLAHILGTTLVDFPGKLASTLFFAGCNLRCPFCHNGDLVLPERYRDMPPISPDELFSFLESRKGFIGGVVFTGGEPLLSEELPEINAKIRSMGFATKLDTNGCFPERLKELVKHVDYVAMDLKAPPHLYDQATGRPGSFPKVKKSIEIIMGDALDYEFRTTYIQAFIPSQEALLSMGETISGARRYVLQPYESHSTLDPKFDGGAPVPPDTVKRLAAPLNGMVDELIIR